MSMETSESKDKVAVDEWHNNQAKMSSKVGMVEPMRIYSQMLSNYVPSLIRVKDHKDLIHVGQVGLDISSFGQVR